MARPQPSPPLPTKTLWYVGMCSLLCMSCGMQVSDNEREVGCFPTGNTFIDTGVYIGAAGCGEVTLHRVATNGSTSSGWALGVGYPAPSPVQPIVFYNATTGDKEREALYNGNPEFNLYAGSYSLGGLKVTSGENAIEVYKYPCVTSNCSIATLIDNFALTVHLE